MWSGSHRDGVSPAVNSAGVAEEAPPLALITFLQCKLAAVSHQLKLSLWMPLPVSCDPHRTPYCIASLDLRCTKSTCSVWPLWLSMNPITVWRNRENWERLLIDVNAHDQMPESDKQHKMKAVCLVSLCFWLWLWTIRCVQMDKAKYCFSL